MDFWNFHVTPYKDIFIEFYFVSLFLLSSQSHTDSNFIPVWVIIHFSDVLSGKLLEPFCSTIVELILLRCIDKSEIRWD